MKKTKIELSDTTATVVAKMSEGNPGAINALIEILHATDVDPDNKMGVLGAIMFLDTLGIYGTDIYILFNDICNRDVVKMLAVLRAPQLGLFNESILAEACHRQDRSGKELVPVEELYLKVKKRLPNFDLKR